MNGGAAARSSAADRFLIALFNHLRMHPLIRSAAVATTVVVSALALTSCQDLTSASQSPALKTSAPAPATTGTPSGSPDSANSSGSANSSRSSGGGAAKGGSGHASQTGAPAGSMGGKVSQACGSNDLDLSARSETQAGGYLLISAKAKPGITCDLDGLPGVAFGSGGTEATNAEQVAGDSITLSGSTTAYAGVNPKTTKDDGGKELADIIVHTAGDGPDAVPASLHVGAFEVDRPIVTNWHTNPSDAVPGDGTDG